MVQLSVNKHNKVIVTHTLYLMAVYLLFYAQAR